MTVAIPIPLAPSAATSAGKTLRGCGPWCIAITCGVLLGTAVVLLYSQTAWFDFVGWDDPLYVTGNPLVRDGVTRASLLRAFVTLDATNWHPLTWLSHMLDCQLYDLKPGGHHLTSVALHAVNACLLFFILWQMTRPRKDDVHQALSPDGTLRAEYWSLGQSAFVAAVFALHPLRAESVAWVSERKDVLAGMFWLLSIGAYDRYVRRPSLWRYLVLAVLFALGLMSKPSVVTLPVVLLLLDYWPLGRFGDHVGGRPGKSTVIWLVIEKLPLAVLSAASSALTVVAQHSGGALHMLTTLPIQARIENALVSYAVYLRDTAWPANLACFYPLEFVISAGQRRVPTSLVVESLLLLLAISALVAVAGRGYPFLTVGWLWYLIVLLPMIGLIQVGDQARADRYTYLPSIGLAIMVAWGLPALLHGWRYRAVVLGAAGAAGLGACVAVSWAQIGTWRDSEALWRRALAVNDENYLAQNGLAEVFVQRHDIDEALKYYRRALQLRPDWSELANNLAWMLATQPEVRHRSQSEALLLAEKVCAANGSQRAAYLDTLAAAYAASGQYVEAVRTGEAAVGLAEAAHDETTAKAIRARVELYRSGQPYREP